MAKVFRALTRSEQEIGQFAKPRAASRCCHVSRLRRELAGKCFDIGDTDRMRKAREHWRVIRRVAGENEIALAFVQIGSKTFAQQVYRAYFVDDRDIASADVIADIAQAVGVNREAFVTNVQSDIVKERFKSESDNAIGRKVFGSPYFFVDNEPFWGVDRFEQLERWLKTGGF